MAYRDNSMDSSRPLNPENTSEPTTPGTPHPEMAFRPPPPRGARLFREGDNDDGNDRHLGGFRIYATSVLRVLTGLFALAAGITGAVASPWRAIETFLVVLDFVILTWNLLALLYSCFGRGTHKRLGGGSGKRDSLHIPEVSLTVGKWKFYYCGDEDSDVEQGGLYNDLVEGEPPKKIVHSGPAPVDAIFAGLMLFFTVLSLNDSWRKYNAHGVETGIQVLHFFILYVALLVAPFYPMPPTPSKGTLFRQSVRLSSHAPFQPPTSPPNTQWNKCRPS